jgi:hypothetical protein
MGFVFGLILGICIGVVAWSSHMATLAKKQQPKTMPKAEMPGITISYEISREDLEGSMDERNATDSWEGSFWEVPSPIPVHAEFRIEYQDGSGEVSTRSIEVRKFGEMPYGALIIAYCRLRDATRTFRSDRIKSCVDEQTGEAISDVTAFLKAKYESSPEFSTDKLYEDEYDALRVLLYMGKADGQLRAAEKTVIAEACRSMASDTSITDKLVGDMLTEMETPTLHAFKLAIGRLAKRPAETKATVLETAIKIVATQKTVHPAEQEALDYMAKRFAAEKAEA